MGKIMMIGAMKGGIGKTVTTYKRAFYPELSLLGRKEPIGNIINFDALVCIFRMPGACDDYFRISIFNLKKRRILTLKSALM